MMLDASEGMEIGVWTVCVAGTHTCACMQDCPTPLDKVHVLKDMIFPQCEKLGQTIIFVRTRESARALHRAVSPRLPCFLLLSREAAPESHHFFNHGTAHSMTSGHASIEGCALDDQNFRNTIACCGFQTHVTSMSGCIIITHDCALRYVSKLSTYVI
jgi:hypothetical protein